MSTKLAQVSTASFDKQVLVADLPTVVVFSGTWCNPCQRLKPVLQAVAEELAGVCSLVDLDIDDSPEIAKRYGVKSIPTLILFHNGQEIARRVGSESKAFIVSMVKNAMADRMVEMVEEVADADILETSEAGK